MTDEPANPEPQTDELDARAALLEPGETLPDSAEPLAEAAEPELAAEDAGSDGPPDEVVATEAPEPPPPPSNKHWYVVKVQSGREESIKGAIERRVKIERLEEFFGQIIIPVERVTEMRNGKRVVKDRKLYPGYLMVEVEYNDRILYLFRETSGVGDFVGGSLTHAPTPMSAREVERMLGRQGEQVPGIKAIKPKFEKGDRVKVKDGAFSGMEGEVKELLETKEKVSVELTIFGRPVAVELEYWQVDQT